MGCQKEYMSPDREKGPVGNRLKGESFAVALPEATGFYERKNMMRLDPDLNDRIDPDEELLTYFEYPALNR